MLNKVESKLSLVMLDRLGESFVQEGLVDSAQLKQALEVKTKTGEHLCEVLLRLNLVPQEKLNDFIAKQLGIPYVDLSNYSIDQQLLSLFDEKIVRQYKIIPLFKIENVITVAMADPLNILVIDKMKSSVRYEIEPVLCLEEEIQRAIEQYYGKKDYVSEIIEMAEKDKGLKEKVIDGSVIKIVDSMMEQAVEEEASDIHIEPEKDRLRIRYRIDGFLQEISSLPKQYQPPIVSRIKVLAKMDIGQKRKSQDGQIRLKLKNRTVDFRISTYAVIHGEKMVIRILDPLKAKIRLEDLGFSKETIERFNQIITEPNGIILVTGPTGSGKTTTLYATLNLINSEEKNIITIEDPIEYQLENINQGNVDEKAGITFANSLRTILRQDPDVIMIGEIRDTETAQLAIRAALTGHLVFSTVHTNDAVGTITRLINMEVDPFLLSSSIRGVLAQRLVRKVCQKCKGAYQPNSETLKRYNCHEKGLIFYRNVGCPQCRGTGYKGRIGIFELLIPNNKIRALIQQKTPEDKIREETSNSGMILLR